MLNKRLRKKIEQHFYNYKEDCLLYDDKVRDIAESGITADFGRVGGGSAPSDPTLNKAMKLAAIDCDKSWAIVVRNTFITFRNKPEGKIMNALYIQGKPKAEIVCSGLWETQFYRWRENWLYCAYEWAKRFNLL